MKTPSEPNDGTRTLRPLRRVTIAHAHTGDQAYLYLVLNGPMLIGSVQLPLADLQQVTGHVFDDPVDHAPVEASALRSIERYLAEHFSIKVDGEAVPLSFDDARIRLLSSGPYLYVDYEAPGLQLHRPIGLEIRYDALVESIAHREAILIALVSRGWKGLYRHEETRFEFDKDHRDRVIEVTKPTPTENLQASFLQMIRLLRGKLAALRSRLGKSTSRG